MTNDDDAVEGLNVINDPKCNKVLNIMTFCPKCTKVLNVINFCPKCNKLLRLITLGLKCFNDINDVSNK